MVFYSNEGKVLSKRCLRASGAHVGASSTVVLGFRGSGGVLFFVVQGLSVLCFKGLQAWA